MSSKHLMAKLLPAPDSPVMTTKPMAASAAGAAASLTPPARWVSDPASRAAPSSAPLRLEPPLVRGQHAQLLAVLGHRAPRDGQALLVQGERDFLVGERRARVLGLHHVADHLLDRDRRHHRAVRRGDPAVEEVLELEQALRRLDVLVG